MKILITSDTHGFYSPISDYILANSDIDLLIHAGDGVDDVKNIAYETDIAYHVVKGNNDYFSNVSYDKVISIANHKIFLTHGHKYDVDFDYKKILQKAKYNECDIAIHGHTHKYYHLEKDSILILNPGSISLPRDNDPGFLIMTLDDKTMQLERIKINEVN